MRHSEPRTASPTPSPLPSARQENELVPLSCPDCCGVLRVEREGPHGHLLYLCQVEHRYAASSLLQAKEVQVERTLWSAVLLLKQMTLVYENLLDELNKIAGGTDRKHVQQRLNQVRKHCLAIGAMIEATYVVE